MKKTVLLLAAVVIAGLSGCSSNNEGPYGNHKSSWYEKHKKADDAELHWCKNDVKRMRTLDACMNANEGQGRRWAKESANINNVPKALM